MFGHVQWMEDFVKAKQSLQWIPGEKRSRSTTHFLEGYDLER